MVVDDAVMELSDVDCSEITRLKVLDEWKL